MIIHTEYECERTCEICHKSNVETQDVVVQNKLGHTLYSFVACLKCLVEMAGDLSQATVGIKADTVTQSRFTAEEIEALEELIKLAKVGKYELSKSDRAAATVLKMIGGAG